MQRPILYSFRRCPYAMRARLAVLSSGVACELREIVLRDKAPEFLAASLKGTVPVVVAPDGTVIEESFDVMCWALGENDPEGWLETTPEADSLIASTEADFKTHLDHYKYASRYADIDSTVSRAKASDYLRGLDARLAVNAHLFGDRITLADMAIAPFVRQFANVDKEWFDAQGWPDLSRWLEAFLASPRFAAIMTKYPKWEQGDPPTFFPPETPDAS